MTGLLEEAAAILASTEEPLAFDSDAGEVNWKSPKLAVKANGPCADLFKVAFSCMAASETVPPAENCFDAFKATQRCLIKNEAAGTVNGFEKNTG